MRPRTLDELVGQQHLVAPGSPLRQLIEGQQPLTLMLWGPPGTGKTTLASLISTTTNRRFVEISAVAAGVKEVRDVIAGARRALANGVETVLFIDEVHRFSKAQQDALLPGVENRWITLVAATTENPHFSVISPLLSRSLLLTLESLTDDDITEILRRALTDERGLNGEFTLTDEAEAHLVRLAGGDGRRILTYLEACRRHGQGTRPRPRSPSTTPRWPSTAPPSATTARAISTTTSSAPSSSPSAAPTSMPRCTTWPG